MDQHHVLEKTDRRKYFVQVVQWKRTCRTFHATQDNAATRNWTQLTSRFPALHAPEGAHCLLHWIRAIAPNTPLQRQVGPVNTAQILEAHQEHEEFNGLQISVHPHIQTSYHQDSIQTQQILYDQNVRVLRQPHHPMWRLHLINEHWILTEPVSVTLQDQYRPADLLLAGNGKKCTVKQEIEQAQIEQICIERNHLSLTRPRTTNLCNELLEVFVHCWTGHSLLITVTRQTKIQTIVDKVAQRTQLRHGQIHIANNGQKCPPEDDIGTQNIKRHEVIHAYVAPEQEEPSCLHQPMPLDPRCICVHANQHTATRDKVHNVGPGRMSSS